MLDGGAARIELAGTLVVRGSSGPVTARSGDPEGPAGEAVGEVVGDLDGLVLVEPVLGDEAGEEAGVDPAGHVVAGRDA